MLAFYLPLDPIFRLTSTMSNREYPKCLVMHYERYVVREYSAIDSSIAKRTDTMKQVMFADPDDTTINLIFKSLSKSGMLALVV